MASHKSSALKSFVWRVMGVIVLASVTYFFTRQWITTTCITAVHHAVFLLVFYLHERFWLKLGRPQHPIKALTYEIVLGIGIGGLIVLLFTGEWSKITQITITYTAIKLAMYYAYDRFWKVK